MPTPTPTPTGLTVTPASVSVALSGAQTFSATENNSAAMVTWSVNGVSGGNASVGTIDANGNFTGPANLPSPNTVTVTATLQSSAAQTANSSVTIVYPNNNHTSQTVPIELGTTGGNSTDSTTSGKTITCCSGTLGSLIQRGGTLFILSNNHVLDKSDRGTAGDPVTQPGLVDNNCSPGVVVANLSQAAALKPTSGTNGPSPSNVDAAIAQIVTGTVDTGGNILDLGTASSSSIAAAPPSATLAVPASVLAANEGVAKSGRSSGLTCSNLQSINTNVSVQYDSTCAGAVAFTSTFSNQLVINGGNFSAPGDSGSLIVTTDTARPVGLLFAGNATATTANPVQDVITAFTNGSGTPSFVGGGDHAVSCQPTATANSTSTSAAASATTLSASEIARVTAVKEKYSAALLENPAIRNVGIAASADNPQEGALLITTNGSTDIPATLDGIRTRVIYTTSAEHRAGVEAIKSAAAIKDIHAESLMAETGVQGVGVGISDDNTSEPAMTIYVIAGIQHPLIPPLIDGLRTKIIEGERFRAFNWTHEPKPAGCSRPQKSQTLQ